MDATPPRTVFLNGAFVPEDKALIPVFDRGFLFADAVYEVVSVIDGRLLDLPAHFARLRRSLAALQITGGPEETGLEAAFRHLVRANHLTEGLVYLQVSRGPADRSFEWTPEARPTVVAFTQARNLLEPPTLARGLSVVLLPDLRWHRRDIKTVQLLAASLAKMEACRSGADDAWLVEDGRITEGTSNNAWILTPEGKLVTRHLSPDILAGVTRAALLEAAEEAGLPIDERPFTPAEAHAAREAFVTSATTFVLPVVRIDGRPVGTGAPGPVTLDLRQRYLGRVLRGATPPPSAAD